MNDTHDPLSILKQAILLETRGHAFYSAAAKDAANPDVRRFFEQMAAEENHHIDLLSEQFRSLANTGKFSAANPTSDAVADAVLPESAISRMNAAGVEAAAVSAAMAMEERAIRLYRDRAGVASDAAEKALYEWLAQWETTHLETLAAIDRTLTESVWNDNQFWPF